MEVSPLNVKRKRKRWNLLSRTLFRRTQNLISEIDGRLLNSKLEQTEISSLNLAKKSLREKIKAKKVSYQSQVSLRLKERIAALYIDIDGFLPADLNKTYED